jgi:polysaccharide pyruvyl transferase WcaK-like protein
MKKVIMFDTSIATLNLGDEIIMDAIRRNMSSYLEQNYCIRMPVHTPMFRIHQNILCTKLKQFSDADYKFICGTNLLYTNMFRPLPVWNVNVLNTKLWKGAVLLGVGSGENSRKVTAYTKFLYSKVLSKRYIHSVRDEKTKEMLESLGYKAINTGCPTLWELSAEHCAGIPTHKADKVVFTLTHYKGLRDIRKDKLMINILRRNYELLFFWPQSIRDLDYLEELGENYNIRIVPANLEKYREVLKGDIDYVGNRLHGGIFALQNRKRTIILAIDHRARNMQQSYSIPSIARDTIDTDLDKLINSDFATSISGIDRGKINLWKSQFDSV